MTNHLLRSPRLVRMLLALSLMLLVAGAFSLVHPAPTAHADSALLDCSAGSANFTFNPGLLLLTARNSSVAQQVEVGSCIGTGDAAGINFGGLSNSGTFLLSCTTLFNGPFTFTYTWNNGTSSTLSLTSTSQFVGSALIITQRGTVSAGIGEGQPVVIVAVYDNTALTACLTSTGLTALSGIETLTIG